MRHAAGTITLVLLVLLAGCSGGILPEGNTTTEGTVSPSGTAGSTTTPDLSALEDPPGTDGERVTNVSTLLGAHVAKLRTLSSYRLVVLEAGENRSNRVEVRADTAKREYVGTRDGWERDAKLYYANGTQYRLVVADDEVETNDATFDRVIGAGTGLLNVLGDLNTTRENTTTVDGTPVVTYRITGARSDAESIETAGGVVQITPDGLIARLSVSLTTSEGSGRLAYAIHDRNGTSVTAPEWFTQRDLPKTVVEPPQLTVEIETRDDGQVEITHASGDTVPSLRVEYTADGESVAETWNPDGNITVGTTFVTENAPAPGTTVRVVWTAGERSMVIAERDVPE